MVATFQSLYTYIPPFLVWPWMGNAKHWPTTLRMRITIPPLPLYKRLAQPETAPGCSQKEKKKKKIRYLNWSSTAAQANVSLRKNSLGYCLNHFHPVSYTLLSRVHYEFFFFKLFKYVKSQNGRSKLYPRCLSSSQCIALGFVMNSTAHRDENCRAVWRFGHVGRKSHFWRVLFVLIPEF